MVTIVSRNKYRTKRTPMSMALRVVERVKTSYTSWKLSKVTGIFGFDSCDIGHR